MYGGEGCTGNARSWKTEGVGGPNWRCDQRTGFIRRWRFLHVRERAARDALERSEAISRWSSVGRCSKDILAGK